MLIESGGYQRIYSNFLNIWNTYFNIVKKYY